MDPHEPHDRDDDDSEELAAALAGLKAHWPSPEQVDPETAALVKRPEFHAAIAERQEIAAREAPAAPAPVELSGAGGTLLVQAEAAATYLPAVEVPQMEAPPRAPSAAVKILGEDDSRRRPTVRMKTRKRAGNEGAGSAGAPVVTGEETNVAATADAATVVTAGTAHAAMQSGTRKVTASGTHSAMPSGTREVTRRGARAEEPRAARVQAPSGASGDARPAAPAAPVVAVAGSSAQRQEGDDAQASSMRPGAPHGRRLGLVIGAAIIFVAGGISVVAGLRLKEPPSGATSSATAPPVLVSTAPTTVAASAPRVEAPAPSMRATSTAPETVNAPPTASVTSSVDAPAPTSPTAPLAPKTSGDPYADASAPVVKSAPSAAPVVTAAPAVLPSAMPVMTAASTASSVPTSSTTTTKTSRPPVYE